MNNPQFLREPDVLSRVPGKPSTVRRAMARGEFPPSRLLTSRTVAWLSSELSAWEAAVRAGNGADWIDHLETEAERTAARQAVARYLETHKTPAAA